MDQLRELQHKAAGHPGALTDREGLLVFKPLNEQELAFYNDVSQISYMKEDCGSDDVSLSNWLPAFLGVLDEGQKIGPGNNDIMTVINDDYEASKSDVAQIKQFEETPSIKRFIVLQNLLSGYNKPNIMDIKLGKIL